MGYQARQVNYKRGISWLAPDGTFWFAESHTVDAAFIVRDVLGIKVDTIFVADKHYDDILINLGWIKLTNSLMFDLYENKGLYDYMTNAQAESFDKWYQYNILHIED